MSEEKKTAVQEVKRGRGRPKGSKNRPKEAQVATTTAPAQA